MTIGAKILQIWFDDYGLIQIGMLSMFVSALIPVYARTDAGLFLGNLNIYFNNLFEAS